MAGAGSAWGLGAAGASAGMHRLTACGPWEPASLAEVAAMFTRCPAPWWVAGGYAVDLAVGRTVREHSDIDVLMLHRDQQAIRQALPSWQLHVADPPGRLREWEPGEHLPADAYDIWCRPGSGQPWRVQVMLDQSAGGEWVSRRDPRIRRPIAALGCVSAGGIPYLAPEIQLFYKAKAPRAKDETDLIAVLPILTPPQRQWLDDAITSVYGQSHPWRAHLST